MSSSNPRNGGGPSSRYNEYLDYGKSRRKNFYSSGSNSQSSPSLQGLSRRDFKSNGSGSSSLSHSKDQNPIPPSVSRNGSYSSSSHYNNNYGNYHDYYLGSGRNDTWRKSSGGESRLSSSSNSSATSSSTSYQQYRSNNATGGDYRMKDRYDSYSTHDAGINTSKWKSGRGFGPSRYSAKDRMRGASTFSSGSNSVPLGSSSLTNSTGHDSYYGRNSYGSSLPRNSSYNKPRDYKYKYGHRSTLIPVEKKHPQDLDSPTSKDEEEDDDDEEDDEEEEEEEEEDEAVDEVQVEVKEEQKQKESQQTLGEEKKDVDNDITMEQDDSKTEIKKIVEVKVEEKSIDSLMTDESVKVETATVEQEHPIESTKQDIPHEVNEPPVVTTEVETIESYDYPLNKIETEFCELKAKFHAEKGDMLLKYSLAKPITNLHHYPIVSHNLNHYHKIRKSLVSKLKNKNYSIYLRKRMLFEEYNSRMKIYEQQKMKMAQQIAAVRPPGSDDIKKEIYNGVVTGLLGSSGGGGDSNGGPNGSAEAGARSTRRYRVSDDELNVILLSLEDPINKAARVAAKIPDLCLDDNTVFCDDNNIVKDKQQWAKRIHTDWNDTFTEAEHEMFCQAYSVHGKKFDLIAKHMGLRTVSDCIRHYYMTKHSTNYKMLLQKRKKTKHKAKRTKKTATTKTPPPVAPTSAPIVVPPEAPKSAPPAAAAIAPPTDTAVPIVSHAELPTHKMSIASLLN
ncbi:putative DNA-binding protein SNT1 [Candida tropicalis]